MIHGETTRSPSASWTATETAYSEASQSHTGHARSSRAPRPGCGTSAGGDPPVGADEGRRRELGREQLRLEPHVDGRLGHLAQHLLAHRPAAGRLLQRGGVQLRGTAEVVLARDVRPHGRAHPRPEIAVAAEALERAGERVDLLLAAHRHLQRNVVRQLREPADVADDDRRPERQRAERARRRLAHRRRAQLHAGGARRHQRPEPALLDVRLANHTLRVEPEPLQPACEVESRRLAPDEQQARIGMAASAPPRTRGAAAGCACSRSDGRSSRRPETPARRRGRRRAPARPASGCARSGRRSRARARGSRRSANGR